MLFSKYIYLCLFCFFCNSFISHGQHVPVSSDEYCIIYDKVIISSDQCYKETISWANRSSWNFSEYLYKIVLCDGNSNNCVEINHYYTTPQINKSDLEAHPNFAADNTLLYIIPYRPVTDGQCLIDPNTADDYSEFNGFTYLSNDNCNNLPIAPPPNTIGHNNRGSQNYHKGTKGFGDGLPTEGFAAIDDLDDFTHSGSRLKFTPNSTGEANCTFTKLPNPIPLMDNYPITYTLKTPSTLSIMIYDANGQILDRLISERLQVAGLHQINWSVKELKGGVYFIVIKTDKEIISEKLIKLN